MATLQTGPITTGDYERQIIEGSPLPPGIYKGIVTKTFQKETKGPGVAVNVEFDITFPQEFCNRKFWDNFNLVHPNQQTTQIAKEAFADLSQAAGLPIIEDDEQLLGREVQMEIYIKSAQPYTDKSGVQQAGKPQNACRKYWPVGVDAEAARKERKAVQKPVAVAQAQPAAARPNMAQKWGQPKPVAQPVHQPVQQAPQVEVQQQAAAHAVAPTGTAPAPWRRPK